MQIDLGGDAKDADHFIDHEEHYNSVKLYGSTNVYTKAGTDFDVLGIAWQFHWGGGL